ncbi:hypothetical protein ACFWHQ_40180 [Streptomyces sp. NPDC060334]|uniref:hypothetical protein n=1 Tax=unclassified Streptomyces TaxID=2593676 RepID=UPI0006ADEB68|nr:MULTISPECIES: hypothetical protein [unclassified Streptomyces]WUD42878.1 hypothetical protein OHA84_21525 [Streptomyces sp. NBC_00513]KOU41641.1 hypothetical protein ADK55_28460 [Streptomyces sp. WM4235]MCX5073905.1 hypothetical protein [Streptomyces sp. NBC_00424]MCX5154534.1 hypothetical protein [Streptomyces sp. NBC_00291]MCY0917623.1 hypothetical protein [Streptomyces sp. H27-G5]
MQCPLHGAGTDPTRLVGRTISSVVASWHVYEGERSEAPLDVWLIDNEGESTRITTGSDQCLIVESESPHAPYDMGEWGRIEVGEDLGDHPFLRHLGETVATVAEYAVPETGRTHLEIGFVDGDRVRADCYEGDLRLTR